MRGAWPGTRVVKFCGPRQTSAAVLSYPPGRGVEATSLSLQLLDWTQVLVNRGINCRKITPCLFTSPVQCCTDQTIGLALVMVQPMFYSYLAALFVIFRLITFFESSLSSNHNFIFIELANTIPNNKCK